MARPRKVVVESTIAIPGVTIRKTAKPLRHLPDSLEPIRGLLLSDDPSDRKVLDDWIESQSWNVAHELWLLTDPTLFQRESTIMVMGRGTTIGHYPEPKEPITHLHYRYRARMPASDALMKQWALNESKRQLEVHRHAHWIRFVDSTVQTTPKGEEAILDYTSVSYDKSGQKAGPRISFRIRCNDPNCISVCYASQVIHQSQLTP